MTDKTIDITGIGNAIVDVLAYTEDAKLAELGLKKGGMTLISEEQSKALYAKMGPATETSGGSVANTVAAIAALGGKSAFIGKVFDDQLGNAFRHDMKSLSIEFDNKPTALGKSTATCLIFVTPDAQRTMATYIGASAFISTFDISQELIAKTKILYLEGYLWDEMETKAALRKAAQLARSGNTKVAFSLSDGFCVDRHRAEFLEFIKSDVDILFANEQEALALTESSSFAEASSKIRDLAEIVAITRSARGSVIISGGEEIEIQPHLDGEVIDTTGAGDNYAAGVLYGITQNMSLKDSGNLGSRLAGNIITQLGARSQKPLAKFLKAA